MAPVIIKRIYKKDYEGYPLPIEYTTETYYDVSLDHTADGWNAEFSLEKFPSPVTHTQEEYNCPDKLFQKHWKGAHAYGAFDGDKLIGAIELYRESWANRIRVTELWIDKSFRRQGIGKRLMDIAKAEAKKRNARMLILETQSCNVNAIGFYLHEGFDLVGFLSCDYSNTDLERKEVRLEMGWFNPRSQESSQL